MEPKMFKTTVIGLGPFCVEFPDGEIVATRSEKRQKLIAAAPKLLSKLKQLVSLSGCMGSHYGSGSCPYCQARDVIDEAEKP